MCKPMSWVNRDGKLYYLTDVHLATAKGKKLREWTANLTDLQGHGAVRTYFGRSFELPLEGGKDCEITDFSTPDNFPNEIAMAIKAGKFRTVWAVYDDPLAMLTDKARAECDRKRNEAWSEYIRKRDEAWSECNRKRNEAWSEYIRKRDEAWSECERKRNEAWSEYIRKRDETWSEYIRKCCKTFWDLFADLANRREKWR